MVGRHQRLIFFPYVVESTKVSDSHWFVWKKYIPPSDLAWDSMVEGIFLITKWAVKSRLDFCSQPRNTPTAVQFKYPHIPSRGVIMGVEKDIPQPLNHAIVALLPLTPGPWRNFQPKPRRIPDIHSSSECSLSIAMRSWKIWSCVKWIRNRTLGEKEIWWMLMDFVCCCFLQN